ncbi:alpha-ketoglutarate-dependent dioxygenase AlkB family protein [Robertkochia sediminum]|uniref:alpha-ketoglutarate-dependent dioxygenase AlkB family protein n=1 Tax=Robertkochia sediminum TaxID=2785326 RepID=UPI001933E6EF|nr:alpha-ketoglutarate-dependent dioxygenase AlkB [Robertkochia sediminum]MBL7471372.1 alpha-ketoglutarate-dependent dioxygenase AlkB [Robertkochia sediminum]
MDQLNLFEEPKDPTATIKIQDGEYIYIPDFYNGAKADHYFKKLMGEIAWKQEAMMMYGREVKFPRLTAWYGDSDKPYSFSGITLNPHSWTPELLEIKNEIEALSYEVFNSVLLNRYRDGSDSISWHTDAEKELGRNPVIASVNFGAERVFQLRHMHTKERIDIPLKHGSLLIMKGALQHFWQHQIPKSKRVTRERINLTFRVIKD